MKKAIQDFYPDEFSHCYGCGRLNKQGLHIKSFPEGEESVCRYTLETRHSGGVPGYAYGGLVTSLIDCHSSATAAAARWRADGLSPGERPSYRFVSVSLKVDFLKPTPTGKVLELRGRVKEMKGRKAVVTVTLSAEGEIRAKGETVLVQIPAGKPGG
ncbi:MAG TPA: PaaI family thioesterase [Syntrophales bacterium]|nr:PaaI family thioesterase [Syntrophales bacterium]HPI57017.1 PaaI family thioesterase [Syntrophales bacterium]HPN23853.1 PaaI family thioesterase [Syntrophales bacterium]